MSNSPVPGAGVKHLRTGALQARRRDGSHTKGARVRFQRVRDSLAFVVLGTPMQAGVLIRDRLLLGRGARALSPGLPSIERYVVDSGIQLIGVRKQNLHQKQKKSSVREQRISEPGKFESCESKF